MVGCTRLLNRVLIVCQVGASLGMFNYGYNSGVINAPQDHIERFIEEVYRQRGFAMSPLERDFLYSIGVAIFAVGGMFGGFSGGWAAGKIGRKGGLMANSVITFLSGLIMYLMYPTEVYELFFVGRFLMGFTCGLSTCISPMYVSEIAPVRIRGALGVVNQVSMALGVLTSQVFGLNVVMGSEKNWPYLLGMTIIIGLVQGVVLIFCPETPPFLLLKRRNEPEAIMALKRLRLSDNVAEELAAIKAEEAQQESKKPIFSMVFTLFKDKGLRFLITIAIFLHCSQQLCGFTGILYYSTSLLRSVGIAGSTAKYCNIGIGSIHVLIASADVWLMDTLGRRTLLLVGQGGMFLSGLAITIGLVIELQAVAVASMLAFVFCYAIGPGPVPWLMTAELFTQEPRAAALGVATFVNWFTNFIVGLGFPMLHGWLKHFVYVPFVVLIFLIFLFTLFCLPETKKKTGQEVYDDVGRWQNNLRRSQSTM